MSGMLAFQVAALRTRVREVKKSMGDKLRRKKEQLKRSSSDTSLLSPSAATSSEKDTDSKAPQAVIVEEAEPTNDDKGSPSATLSTPKSEYDVQQRRRRSALAHLVAKAAQVRQRRVSGAQPSNSRPAQASTPTTAPAAPHAHCRAQEKEVDLPLELTDLYYDLTARNVGLVNLFLLSTLCLQQWTSSGLALVLALLLCAWLHSMAVSGDAYGQDFAESARVFGNSNVRNLLQGAASVDEPLDTPKNLPPLPDRFVEEKQRKRDKSTLGKKSEGPPVDHSKNEVESDQSSQPSLLPGATSAAGTSSSASSSASLSSSAACSSSAASETAIATSSSVPSTDDVGVATGDSGRDNQSPSSGQNKELT